MKTPKVITKKVIKPIKKTVAKKVAKKVSVITKRTPKITKSVNTEFNFRTITSYEAACKHLKINAKKSLPKVVNCPKNLQKYIIALYKLTVINQAIRNGSKLDWNDINKWKYEPYHSIKADNLRSSGFGFDYTSFVNWNTNTFVGSRLCSESREKTLFFAENFTNLWMDFKLEI